MKESRVAVASRLVPFLIAVAGIAGCGMDERYTGMGKGALPGDPLKPVVQDVACFCQGGGGDCPEPEADGSSADAGPGPSDLAGLAWRFDSLVLSAPLTGFLGQGINDYFAKEIAQQRLHVLLAVDKDDRATGTLEARLGAGKADGEAYAFDGQPSDLECTLAGTWFETASETFLAFPNEQVDPPALPVNALGLSGRFLVDGTAISEGLLVGALTVEDAKKTQILGQSLYDTLTAMEVVPDVDTDGKDGPDAYRFEGTWTASVVSLAGGK
jgi:hypothetical protein